MTPSLPPLTADLWLRVRDTFSAMADLSVAEQTAQLCELERTDPPLAAHVTAMVRASTSESTFDSDLDTIVGDLLSVDTADVRLDSFGPYRLVKPLGRGGMGIVYLGRRDDLGALAAIKILPHAWIDPSRREQFIEEMRILSDLSHESIAGLLHAGQLDDGTPWFAMQYVEGEPITEWVWRNGLSVERILRLFDNLCAAVQHAHGYPVVHRDLKPSNALVTSAGAVKLLDFGIAKRLQGLQQPGDGTRTVTREVTVEYAAPEQLRGQTVGVRADVYALGIMLYELIEGHRPYEAAGLTPAEAEAAIRAAYLPKIARAMRSDERRDIEALLSRATAPDAVDRYGSVEEMRRDIAAFLDRRPLIARKAGWVYRSRKFASREWRALSVAAALVVAIATGIVLRFRSLQDSRDFAIAEARTTRLRQYVEDLFQGGGVTSRRPDTIRVAALVENGIRGARTLTTDPVIQLELLSTLGTMSQRMGALARADSLFLQAIERSTAVYGPNNTETFRARLDRGQLLAQRGQPDSAEIELREVNDLAHTFAPAQHPVRAETDAALGTLLRERSHYADAIPYLERALDEEAARDTASREFAATLRELGNAEWGAGNVARSDSLWRRALPLARRLFGPRHPDVADLLSNIGNAASRRGELVEAERNQREAVSILSGWYGDDHYLTAAANGALSQTLIRLKRFDEAIAICRKTIDIFTRSPDIGPSSQYTAVAHSTLASAFSYSGDHEAAIVEFERAYAALKRSVGESATNTITAATNVAMETLHAGHVDSAVAALRRQLTIATDAYGVDGLSAAQVRARLGEALVAQGDVPEAITLTEESLRVLDAKLGAHASATRTARQTLLAAYVKAGDSASAARVRAALADSIATPTVAKK